jgi:hypothetical protein
MLVLLPLLLLLLAVAAGEASSGEAEQQQCDDDSGQQQSDEATAARRQHCEFRTLTAAAYAARPRRWDMWEEPLLITGAASHAAFRAPFEHLELLLRGEYDETHVAVGPAVATTLFDGAAAKRVRLGEFRREMAADDAVFDTQNSGSGRHAALPIPGVDAEEAGWWNVLSIGTARAGLTLHEHGAAWLALGSGSKLWAVFPPAHEDPNAYGQRSAVESSASWFAGVSTGLRCSQPSGSVVLLPEGWVHTTLNSEEAWGVGRQHQWRPEHRLCENRLLVGACGRILKSINLPRQARDKHTKT